MKKQPLSYCIGAVQDDYRGLTKKFYSASVQDKVDALRPNIVDRIPNSIAHL
tara:strand:- start:261 stop:416 length:156 start_codon:yes stop_codon:yes gene_type:complete